MTMERKCNQLIQKLILLVDTKELLEFIDTMDVGDTSKVDESVSQKGISSYCD